MKLYHVYFYIKANRTEYLCDASVYATSAKEACKAVKEWCHGKTGKNAFRPTCKEPTAEERAWYEKKCNIKHFQENIGCYAPVEEKAAEEPQQEQPRKKYIVRDYITYTIREFDNLEEAEDFADLYDAAEITVEDAIPQELCIPKIDAERHWSADSVRECCIRNGLYTLGNAHDYEAMLENVGAMEPYFDNLYLIARDITAHSDEQEVGNVMYLLENQAVKTCFSLSWED